MSVKAHRAKDGEHRRKHKSRRRGHKDRREKGRRIVASLVKRFWFELLAVGLLTLGVFLLVERLQIKTIVFQALMELVEVVANAASALWNRTVIVFHSVEKSDLVGIALVLIAVWMIALSLRWRAIRRHPRLPLDKECPQCQRDLYRRQRRLADRLLELTLRVRIRRYACTKCSFRASVWRARGESG